MEVIEPESKKETLPAPTAPQVPPAYKFRPDAYAELGTYLLRCPIAEVKPIYHAFFRHGKKDPFYKAEAVDRLMSYLLTRPMGEVEGLLSLLESGGLMQYVVAPAPTKEEAPAAVDTPPATPPATEQPTQTDTPTE